MQLEIQTEIILYLQELVPGEIEKLWDTDEEDDRTLVEIKKVPGQDDKPWIFGSPGAGEVNIDQLLRFIFCQSHGKI